MILVLLSVFFCWLIFREVFRPTERFSLFSAAYITVLASLAAACALPAYKIWRLEIYLSEKASIIAERPNVVVKCNSIFETILDGKGLDTLAGTAYFQTGEIFFEDNWCKSFIQYLDHPERASRKELFAMHVFTHEVMHIRGERNESKTDCQAIQRNHTVGELLGVDASIARKNALKYYNTGYQRHPYFDKNCRPRGKYDERLPDSIWANKGR